MKVRALTAAAIAFAAIPNGNTRLRAGCRSPTRHRGRRRSAEPRCGDRVPAEAAEEAPAEGTYEAFMAGPDAAMFTVNNLWILISAALVFIMHLGFCSVESGLCQQKNTVNILFKNVFIVCIGALGYMAVGLQRDVSRLGGRRFARISSPWAAR